MEDSIPVPNIDPLVTTLQSGFSTEVIVGMIVIAVLLVCSALISGSEAAFFSLSPAEKDSIKSSDNKKGQTAQRLLDKPQDLLATILITNNFVNVAVVILCSSVLQEIYPPAPGNETVRLIIEVFLITLILLLAGEVIPKIYATQNSMRFALFMSSTLNGLGNIPPISWIKQFLVNGSNIIQKNARKKGIKISSTELEQALALTKEENASQEEHKILEGIVKFGNTEVCQIMRSRVDVIALDQELDFQQVMAIILESGYSRIPVYKDSFDNVTGILFIKDILPFLEEQDNPAFDWLKLTRKPFFVPENKKIDDLLKEFQGKKVHMAVIVDEYGGASGLCTLEDVLEEIVGDITDEFDDDEIVFTKIDEGTFLFEGKTALVDVYKVLETDGKEFDSIKGDAETIGGFIVENAGRILKNNEYIDAGNYRLIVESSDKRRVKMVKIVIQSKPE